MKRRNQNFYLLDFFEELEIIFLLEEEEYPGQLFEEDSFQLKKVILPMS